MFIYLFSCFFLIFLGSIYVLKPHGGFGWVMREETGPNDASRAVSAIGIFIDLFSCFIFIFLGSIYVLKAHGRFGWATRDCSSSSIALSCHVQIPVYWDPHVTFRCSRLYLLTFISNLFYFSCGSYDICL